MVFTSHRGASCFQPGEAAKFVFAMMDPARWKGLETREEAYLASQGLRDQHQAGEI